MPTPTSYNKSITNDFPNGKVNTSTLSYEISISDISISLLRIDTENDLCEIWFRDVLSSAEEIIYESIISSHKGEKTKEEIPTVSIQEEYVATGGHFSTKSINIVAQSNSSAIVNVHWPFPITALAMKLTTDSETSKDSIDMSVGANTIVGILSSDSGNNISEWQTGNYTLGDKVLYTVPFFGQRPFTCIKTTTSNEPPSNKTYWRHGYELIVSPTVLENSKIGFFINLFDGSNSQDLGRILYKSLNSIYVENIPTTNFLVTSPTYVRQTVYVLKDHYIGNGRIFSIGEGKIGGSYVPTDVIVGIKYTNRSSVEKSLLGFVEYLY